MKLALFDFDETLIQENSLSCLFKTVSGKDALFPDVFSLAFNWRTYKNGIKYSIRNRLYARCLKGVSEDSIIKAGESAAQVLHPLEAVVEQLKQLKAQNYTIWIVTATPTLFVKAIAQQWDWPVDLVVGTELYQTEGIYTGKFDLECMKQEKVRRVNEVIAEIQIKPSIEIAYGNLPVDIPMLEMATKKRYAVKGKQFFLYK